MIWFALSAGVVAVAAIYATIQAVRKSREWRRRYREEAESGDRLRHIIRTMEGVARETAEKKRTLHTGSDRERFDAANDILSDTSRSGRSRDHD